MQTVSLTLGHRKPVAPVAANLSAPLTENHKPLFRNTFQNVSRVGRPYKGLQAPSSHALAPSETRGPITARTRA